MRHGTSPGGAVRRFAGRAWDWVVPAGRLPDEPATITRAALAVSHGNVVLSGDPRRVDLSIPFPLSDPFARRYLGASGSTVTTRTMFRGHAQVPGELVAHRKGRIVPASVEGARVTPQAEPLFTSMRRHGVRATYQCLCRHVPHAAGCRLDIADFLLAATATARSGVQITVREAANQPDGWYRAGVSRHAGMAGFITGHVGTTIMPAGRMADPEAASDEPGTTANVGIAPGCDLRRDTCSGRFDNLLNFGGFPDIPGRNSSGGTRVI